MSSIDHRRITDGQHRLTYDLVVDFILCRLSLIGIRRSVSNKVKSEAFTSIVATISVQIKCHELCVIQPKNRIVLDIFEDKIYHSRKHMVRIAQNHSVQDPLESQAMKNVWITSVHFAGTTQLDVSSPSELTDDGVAHLIPDTVTANKVPEIYNVPLARLNSMIPSYLTNYKPISGSQG